MKTKEKKINQKQVKKELEQWGAAGSAI